ncbi:MFS transporter [Paenibacillus sp. FSL H7-0942]|jgi:putative MFS transporter|uniref:MFS transporter n=1 Tax=Paenibacillus amylolyticus TaxID=1451 RepID=A0A100VNA4_PAEAM|nr:MULTISPECIES: MFS transporter [Paenibacillus]ETT29487.1 major facilitator superfamily protein [Paenibacillus sp. FSL R5-192]ETT44857.1 major facilitator superfamily protein [Paenibacillus sp. FSL H7-689]KLU55572.1 major facilitator transporter [Paenibacillus sp. VT-400]MBY0117738.1 MFS transporter [Paenibacillus xylanexedens]MCF7753198.1 MFS transporter [Paenibacillus xylanexedens]
MSKLEVLRNPKQRKLLFSAGMSWLFDAMEVGMISFIVAALAKEWSLSPGQVGVLTSINSIGMALGALLAGALADRFGRKAILMWTLLIFTIASGLSALATGFAVLCALRLVAGIGLGGELPVASTLVSESMPTAERGRAVVLLESFWAGGWIVSALIANFVIPEYGWRIAFAIGALPAFYALYLRRAIQDPPRYKNHTKLHKITFREKVATVWSAPHRRTTLMLWILWFTVIFSYYGMFLWLPSVVMAKGFTLVKSFQYVLIMTIAQLPGYFTAAYFIERYGRKFVLVVYLTLTAFSAIAFGLATTEATILTAGICLSFFNLGAWGGLYAYSPELYPTSVRSTGVGLATSVGRIGGVLAPLMVGMLVQREVAISLIFTIFFVTILIGAAAVLFWGRETKGQELAE